MSRFGYLAVIVFRCWVLLPHRVSSYESDTSSISVSSYPDALMPCVYRGVPYRHGESWLIDECTTCTCDNTTIRCQIETCQPMFCAVPFKKAGTCCYRCPYDVRVSEVRPSVQNQFEVSPDGDVSIVLAVEVAVMDSRHNVDVNGDSLWELAAWVVRSNTTTNRLEFSEQVLDANQMSQVYRKGKVFVFRDVMYQFNAPFMSLVNCSEQQSTISSEGMIEPEGPSGCGESVDCSGYVPLILPGFNANASPVHVCVQLKKGSDAHPSHSFPFMVRGKPDETSLIGCTSVCPGPDIAPCEDSTGTHLHEDIWQLDTCTECTCNNGISLCSAKECHNPDCRSPVRLEGQCCLSCPYHVRVKKVSPLVVTHGLIGNQEDNVHLRVPIRFHESNHTTHVKGVNLWKLSAWVALNQSNIMKRYDYAEQILSDEARSKTHQIGEELVFEGIEFRIVDSAVVCDRPFLICVRFDMDSEYQTKHERGFELSGLPDNSSLIGCTSTTLPKEWCTVDQLTNGTFNNNDTSNSANIESLMSCDDDGNSYIHGEEWKPSDCLTCDCDNSTITCRTEWCEPTHCQAPIKHPGECCYTCTSESSPNSSDNNDGDDGRTKPDVCVPLVISVIILAAIVILILSVVFILRRKRMVIPKDDNGPLLKMSYNPESGDVK